MSTEITINQDIVEVNVTEQVITIEAPSGAYPLPSLVNSVFGRVGNVVAAEGDYTLTQLGDVTLTSPANGQVLKYNGTQWVNVTGVQTCALPIDRKSTRLTGVQTCALPIDRKSTRLMFIILIKLTITKHETH